MNKYVYNVSFSERIALWQNVDAVVVSDTPLTEKELNEKIKNYEYDVESNETEWNDVNRIEVSPIYDYSVTENNDGQ